MLPESKIAAKVQKRLILMSLKEDFSRKGATAQCRTQRDLIISESLCVFRRAVAPLREKPHESVTALQAASPRIFR
jgi:hypothetical protein